MQLICYLKNYQNDAKDVLVKTCQIDTTDLGKLMDFIGFSWNNAARIITEYARKQEKQKTTRRD